MSAFDYGTCFVGPVSANKESRSQFHEGFPLTTPLQHFYLFIQAIQEQVRAMLDVKFSLRFYMLVPAADVIPYRVRIFKVPASGLSQD